MEYHIVSLKAKSDTLEILESHWTLTHQDGEHTAYRFGVVIVTDNVHLEPFNTLTEEQAIEATKEIMGAEQVAALEQSCLDEIEFKKDPPYITGTPWATDESMPSKLLRKIE